MWRPALLAVSVLALVATTAAGRARPADVPCAQRTLSAGYASSVQRAVASRRDLWGEELLRTTGGPTLSAARRFLAPLGRAVQWHRQPLTPSGSYYVPLSFAFSAKGSTVYALHVADGSEIASRVVGGPSLSVYVGSGNERFGACASRGSPARLAAGYLPILRTGYVDGHGVRYRQESFVGRALGARSVVSFLRITVDARDARRASTVRLVPWRRLARIAPARLGSDGRARLVVSAGASFSDRAVRWRVLPGTRRTIYAAWLHAPSAATYLHATPVTYDRARALVVRLWRSRLRAGATFDVPEPAVQDAERAVLTQLIAYGWRYSIGNQYEELSYAESLDAAEVAAQYGYSSVARSIIELALRRMQLRPWRFTAFRGAHILRTAALYYRLTDDRGFLRSETPALQRLVSRIANRQLPSGRLHPEPLSTDLEDEDVDSVSGQIEAVQGLRAIAGVWASAGVEGPAARARTLAASIDRALRPAVEAAVSRSGGSLFVPSQLSTPQAPFERVTTTRAGSYWNLVMPYAFSSGWFSMAQSRGILRYLDGHGSLLLGMPRTWARTVYLRPGGAGVAPAYGLGIARFLADVDTPDREVLTLYGLLAAGMTPQTYISGEAVTVLPVDGVRERMMLMPPNTGSNASYLGALRELLVHERATGLDLAFATPRAWLADGRTIRVHAAPTSFGRVSYSIARRGRAVAARLVLPAVPDARLRLRLPAGERLGRVLVGGRPVRADRAGTIDLGRRRGTVLVRAAVD